MVKGSNQQRVLHCRNSSGPLQRALSSQEHCGGSLYHTRGPHEQGCRAYRVAGWQVLDRDDVGDLGAENEQAIRNDSSLRSATASS